MVRRVGFFLLSEDSDQERFTKLAEKFRSVFGIKPQGVVRVPGVAHFPSSQIIELQNPSIVFNLQKDMLIGFAEYDPSDSTVDRLVPPRHIMVCNYDKSSYPPFKISPQSSLVYLVSGHE